MAELIFTASQSVGGVKPLDPAVFNQFHNYRFGVYHAFLDEDGKIQKRVGKNPISGVTFSPNMKSTSLSFEEAALHVNNLSKTDPNRQHGLILYMPDDLVCVDFDGTDLPSTDEKLRDNHYSIINHTPTWVEKSVSGVGYHAFYRVSDAEAAQLTNTSNHDNHIDTRVRNGFVFLTGDVVYDHDIGSFDNVDASFRSYLFARCESTLIAESVDGANWYLNEERNDNDVLKQFGKRYADSFKFMFTRQDQTGTSEEHWRAVKDLIRCSMNYEQVERIYLGSECAEYAQRSERRQRMGEAAYRRHLIKKNLLRAAADLVAEGRFFNPDDVMINGHLGADDEESEELVPEWYSNVNAYTSVDWIVKDMIPAQGVCTIYGPSGSGKTFLALDMLAAIVSGQEWFGRKTKKVPVTYVGLEGRAGLNNRIYAYRKVHEGVENLGEMMLLTQTINLSNSDHVQKLIRVIRRHEHTKGILVIDTMAKSAPGMDENSSEKMSSYIATVEELARQTEGCVILVHHSGKDTERGPRGHSSFLAGVDAAIEVQRGEGLLRTWTTKKVKDGNDGQKGAFELEAVEIGRDQWNTPESSCVIKPAPLPNIEEFMSGVSVSFEDCEVLVGVMLATQREHFDLKRNSTIYAMCHEMEGWPQGWDKARTEMVVAEAIKLGYIEKFEYSDVHRNKKEGYRVCFSQTS